ncbi:hypothetical protein C8R43DRAFT_957672 [Mycena crocata]|nr:hypothetical protein C8R43DRAFT_957672 [Mycena crocata]
MSGSNTALIPQSERFWFGDGTVIIRTKERIFRVYMGLLAKKMEPFRGFRDLPQPPNAEILHGCPVVPMDDDSDDMEFYLRVLIDGYMFPLEVAGDDVDIVLGALQTATKYCAPEPQLRCIHYLNHLFPVTLCDWDTRRDVGLLSLLRYALDTAMQCQMLWFVPGICYDIIACTAINHPPYLAIPPEQLSTFTVEQRLLILHGSATVLTGAIHLVSAMRSTVLTRCTNPGVCAVNVKNIAEEWHHRDECDPFMLGMHDNYWEDLDSNDVLCFRCIDSVKKQWQNAREQLWDKLPTALGLPDWEQLRDARSGAMKEQYAYGEQSIFIKPDGISRASVGLNVSQTKRRCDEEQLAGSNVNDIGNEKKNWNYDMKLYTLVRANCSGYG